MKWIEIQENNIDRVNAQIKKTCDVYCLLYLKIKVGRQQRVLELSGRDVDPLNEDAVGDELLNKLPQEWKSMEKEQLVEELSRSLRQRHKQIESFISSKTMEGKSNLSEDDRKVNFDEFKKNERIRKKLKFSKDTIRKTLKKFPLALLNELDRKIRNLLVEDDGWEEAALQDETGDPMKFIEKQFGGGMEEIDDTETVETAQTDSPREVVYKIILNKQEFEELKKLRKRKFNTSKFLKKGEGTFFKKGYQKEVSRPKRQRKIVSGNTSRSKVYRNDPFLEDMLYEAKYLNSSEPYRDPIHVIPLRKDSDRRARGEGLVDEYMRETGIEDEDNLNITNALNRMDDTFSRRKKSKPKPEKPRWCSVTKSLTTTNYDKNFFLGELYRHYRY